MEEPAVLRDSVATEEAKPSGWGHILNQITSAFNRLSRYMAAKQNAGVTGEVEMEDEDEEPRITEFLMRQMGFPRRYLVPEQRRELGFLMDMFPDACPRWIAHRIREHVRTEDIYREMITQPEKFDKLVTNETSQAILARIDALKDKAKYNFNPADYLKRVPDPEASYNQINGDVKPLLYVDLSTLALQNDFPEIRLEYMKKILGHTKYHFYPAYREFKDLVATQHKPKHSRIRQTSAHTRKIRIYTVPWAVWDDSFIDEYLYALYDEEIWKYQVRLSKSNKRKEERARQRRETLTQCPGCQRLCEPGERISCAGDSHPFCTNCVAASAESKLKEGITKLFCLHAKCDNFYENSELVKILKPGGVEQLKTNVEQEELKASGNENMRECPLCHFAILVDQPDLQKVFRCENSDCERVWCMNCNKSNHGSLTCEEAEKLGDITTARRAAREGGVGAAAEPAAHIQARELFLQRNPQLRGIEKERSNTKLKQATADQAALAQLPLLPLREQRKKRMEIARRKTLEQRAICQKATINQSMRLRAWIRGVYQQGLVPQRLTWTREIKDFPGRLPPDEDSTSSEDSSSPSESDSPNSSLQQ